MYQPTRKRLRRRLLPVRACWSPGPSPPGLGRRSRSQPRAPARRAHAIKFCRASHPRWYSTLTKFGPVGAPSRRRLAPPAPAALVEKFDCLPAPCEKHLRRTGTGRLLSQAPPTSSVGPAARCEAACSPCSRAACSRRRSSSTPTAQRRRSRTASRTSSSARTRPASRRTRGARASPSFCAATRSAASATARPCGNRRWYSTATASRTACRTGRETKLCETTSIRT